MPGITELLVILLIVALLFGTKKLRSMGGDLGGALKSFRSAVKDEEPEAKPIQAPQDNRQIIEGEVETEVEAEGEAEVEAEGENKETTSSP